MSPDVAGVCLRAEHAIELGELLEFVGHWLDGAPEVFGDALVSFCGAGYTLGELRDDLARFVLLLGGDGERVVVGDDR